MKQTARAYVILFLVMSIWGGVYVVSKEVMETIPYLSLLFLRYFFGAGLILLILAITGKLSTLEKVRREDWLAMASVGVSGYLLGIGMQLAGTHFCDASVASLINSMNPVVILILAWIILKEKITLIMGAGIGVTMVGALIIIGQVDGTKAFWGAVLSVASVFFWSLGSVLVRFVSQRYSTMTITIYGMLVATFCSLPLFLFEAQRGLLQVKQWDAGVIVGLLYIVVISTTIGMFLWNKALSMADAATCSLFYPIQPLMSAILGAVFLGERFTGTFFLGGALILGGILFVILKKK